MNEALIASEKVHKYEDFIHNKIDPDILVCSKKLETIYKQMEQYETLKNTVEMLEAQKITKLDTKVDIG